MNTLFRLDLLKVIRKSSDSLRNFHKTATISYYNFEFRKQRGWSKNPNSFGPLTNLPDYSFKDGRPVPYGSGQKRRIDEQRENLVKIKELVGQIDSARENYKQKQLIAQMRREEILKSKLKEKGTKLLKSTYKDIPK